MVEQIKEKGVLNPITVIPRVFDGIEKYSLVDGERRYRAVLLANEQGADIRRIKAIFLPKSTKPEDMLIEQVMRNEGKNFTEYEFGLMFLRFKRNGYNQTEIADKFKKSTAFVSRCLSLMDLPRDIQDKLEKNEITVNAVKSIMANNDDEGSQVEAVKATVETAKQKGKSVASNKDVDPDTQKKKDKKALMTQLHKLNVTLILNEMENQLLSITELLLALEENVSVDEAVKSLKETI